MFHALDLAVKILHFALLSAMQNKPFRSAISNTVFCRLFCKICKRLALRYSRKMAKTDLYNERKREGRREDGVEVEEG